MSLGVAIIGGDMRQIYLSEMFENSGHKVFTYALKGDEKSLIEIIEKCNVVLLPMPVSRDGVYINAPLSDKKVSIFEIAKLCGENKTVLGGIFGSSADAFKCKTFDYGKCETLAVINSALTAEGAVAIAVSELPKSLFGMKCLITGYGRVAKALSERLAAFHTDVFVAARKEADLAWIRERGMTPIKISELSSIGGIECIFNTVPSIVIGKEEIENLSKDTVIIELASLPGGIDRESAKLRGIKVIDAPSLPGKTAPKTSAEIIYDAIKEIMKGEKV